MTRIFLILFGGLLAIAGCDDKGSGDTADTGVIRDPSTADLDGDGYTVDEGDCNDLDPLIGPDAAEICDEQDNDCDGDVDEDVTTTYFLDADADGFGNEDELVETCTQPSGYVPRSDDCDDSDSETYPNASESCDQQDNDCDGEIDEGAVDAQEWFYDADADGFGDPTIVITACSQPSGYLSNKQDCDDSNPDINPWEPEACDGIDNDCDGYIDDDDLAGDFDDTTLLEWWGDADADGYGDSTLVTEACEAPTGYVGNESDCDDTNSDINPDAREVCDGDGIDENCDGIADEIRTWYEDADSDGYGDASSTQDECDQPTGYVADDTDCDDTESTTNPGATEYCDSVDNDCDGTTDESDAADAVEWWADNDSDGYGDTSSSSFACSQPSGYVSNDDDCDDADAAISPDATEVCDEDDIDEDCNGFADDADSGVDTSTQTTFYADSDSDGYGDLSSTFDACDEPSGYVSDNSDCNDGNASVNPGATEVCDSADTDEDCDGDVDDADSNVDTSTYNTFYADSDSDGYGDASSSTDACDEPSGYVSDATDCDDTNVDINPAANEVCDDLDVDEDCDGVADDSDSSTDTSTMTDWYPDSDSDGYGDSSTTATSQCEQPTGYVEDNSDCDDADASTGSGNWYPDQDEDGYGDDSASVTSTCTDPSDSGGCTDGDTSTLCYVAADNSDCDDSEVDVNPDGIEASYDLATDTVTENCSDSLDNDCNGDVDTDDVACDDLDGDGLEDGIQVLFASDVDSDGDDDGLVFGPAFEDGGSAWVGSDCITTNTYPWTSITVSSAEAPVSASWGGRTYALGCLMPRTSGYAIQKAFSDIGSDGSSAVDATDVYDWVGVGLQTYCGNASAGGLSDFCANHSTYGWYTESTYDSSTGLIYAGP